MYLSQICLLLIMTNHHYITLHIIICMHGILTFLSGILAEEAVPLQADDAEDGFAED